jgi:DNA repair protein RadD
MSAPELRQYQTDFSGEFWRRIEEGFRRILGVAPTGAGKTVIAGEIIRRTKSEFKSALFIAHRREIISQTSQKLRDINVPHGIIMAGTPPRPLEYVQLAAIQTLHYRAIHADTMPLPPADLLIIDEAHHSCARTYRKIIDTYPSAIVLGLTATPCRGDGRGLGGIFQTIIECPQVAALIEMGHLVKTRCYAPTVPDLVGVHTVAGDYHEGELAARMDQDRLVGDIVTNWHKLAGRRKTVVFAVNVQHSVHIKDEFIASGVRTEHIDGRTPKPERDATLARLASGDIDLITNCMVLTEGWDMPEVGACILARPTRKMGLYRQMIGRVLRPAEGKADAIILDHSGAVFRHGFAEDFVEWTLDPDRRAKSRTHERRGHNGSRLIECTNCGAVRVTGEPCFHCGFLPQRPPRAVDYVDGDLGLVDRQRRVKTDINDPAVRAQWHAMLAYIANERGYQRGWIAHKYKEKFGAWPPWGAVAQPIPPSQEVRSWVRSRMIAFAKGRRSA